eukprot:195496-Amphidinium_carterae.1
MPDTGRSKELVFAGSTNDALLPWVAPCGFPHNSSVTCKRPPDFASTVQLGTCVGFENGSCKAPDDLCSGKTGPGDLGANRLEASGNNST